MNALPSGSEHSTMSRSATEDNLKGIQSDLATGHTTIFDAALFPLYEETFKNARLPSFLYQLIVIIGALQVLASAVWPSVTSYIVFNNNVGQFFYYYFSIVFFNSIDETDLSKIAFISVMSVVIAFIIAVNAFMIIYYRSHRRFNQWALYLSRFSLEPLPFLILIPLAKFSGMMFLHSIEEPITQNIAIFVTSLVFYLFIIFVFGLTQNFISLSPYLSTSPTTSWDGFVIFIFPTILSLYHFFSYFLTLFAHYIFDVWIISKIVFDVWMAYKSAYQPFVQLQTNALLGALFGTSIIMDFIALLAIGFNIRTPQLAIAILSFVLNFITLLILHFIYGKVKKSTRKMLNYTTYEGEKVDPNAIYLENHLDTKPSLCELCLRVGLTEMCPMFLDNSLIKFICVNHPNMVFSCLRFASFFPSESLLINALYKQASRMQKINISQRFLLYQIHKVKGLRTSSASAEITETLVQLQANSRQVIAEIHGFWKTIPKNPLVFYDLKNKVESTKAKYKESLEKWPNNIKLHDDFHILLIEGAMEFNEALKIKNKAELAELGKNFAVDQSFRSLVRAYPYYVKRNILDWKGRKINNTASSFSRKHSVMSTDANDYDQNNSSLISSGTIDGELDVELEERYAKASFTYPRLRLAYEKALSGRFSKNSWRLKLAAIWSMVLLSSSLLFIYIHSYDLFDKSSQNMEKQLHLSFFRLGFDNMFNILVIDWLRNKGIIQDDLFNKMAELKDSNLHSIILSNDLNNEANYWIGISRINFISFLNNIIELATEEDDLIDTMKSLLQNVTPLIFCGNGVRLPKPSVFSLNNIFAYIIQTSNQILYYNQINGPYDYDSSNMFCEIIVNQPGMSKSFDNLSLAIYDEQVKMSNKISEDLFDIMNPMTLILFALTEPSLIIFLALFFNELEKLLKLMKDVDPASQVEAANNIIISCSSEDSDYVTDTSGSSKLSKSYYFILIFLPVVIGIAIFVAGFFLALSTNTDFLNLNKWMYFGVWRQNYVMEILSFLTFALGSIYDPQISKMFSTTESLYVVSQLTRELVTSNHILIHGSLEDDVISIVSENEEFDMINMVDRCEWDVVGDNISFRDSYKCFSLSRLIQYYSEHVTNIFQNPTKQKFELDSDYYYMWDMANNFILTNASICANVLWELTSIKISSVRSYQAVVCFGGIGFLIVTFFFFWMELNKLDKAYEGALMMLKRLPPPVVISNANLYSYLLDNSGDKKEAKMTAAKSAIHLSNNAVICLSRVETIEIVNQAVTTLFGYMPDQLLGQLISVLLPDNKDLEQQFALMRNGESSLLYECSTEATSDDDQKIPVHLNLIGIAESSSSSAAKSFVVILRDETNLRKRREEVEKAKKSSETLLFQILPRDIVSRINSGETDISFVVPIATIIFVDIVRFSDYASTLSPSQIMENLSIIFAHFDQRCAKYPTMTKIKLIGDVYMAAAGLFENESTGVESAIEVVQFGLEALMALEEVNTSLDSSLQVRIGVNTDGPIIAGVLGTDKPVFDIIGDPINVSARLQSNGIPGTIQISQMTYDKIRDANFNIEQRGEIELKGKGKRMAYIVKPNNQDSFMFGEQLQHQSSALLEQQTTPQV
ncbi:Adenylate and Guanylate cyclase catalytic domain containing protein [Tritrichomonas foetus]|uniref:Adenylate and Guanylate cyclase catalytic domain containing protein n=1 Tax=Tritrichomonas foetus TaxID=1144522 RepID=A0A1J4KI49_9EUKA|nr:Adenylate and Guanylate cyclase catalytic domain containing protein [Tritrichomonas foetus]|eukprot:OHT09500.1 Adenylate and Guanylate cyclase catalytic domain containing protein [Tritrichomonas foetus]